MNETDQKGMFVIRGDDAHAFAEVYLTGIGWYSMDPTISAGDTSDGLQVDSLVRFIGLMVLGGCCTGALQRHGSAGGYSALRRSRQHPC